MRLGTNAGNTDNGEGTEVGKGIWVLVTAAPDAKGDINLRPAQDSLHLTGYYRPEDMDVDPSALAQGIRRVCWTIPAACRRAATARSKKPRFTVK